MIIDTLALSLSTGDVEGGFLSDKVFIVKTSTGDIDIPNTITGGKCAITTNTGETIRDVMKQFPYWFCKHYEGYAVTNIPEDFDQHYLLASVVPRFVYVGSGNKDLWADPTSEFQNTAATSAYYEKLGLTSLVHNDKLPEPAETFHEGRVGYHARQGYHFLSRHDW